MSLLIQYRFDEASASIGTDSVGSLDMTNTGVTTVSETFGSHSINAAYFDGSSHLNLPKSYILLLGKTHRSTRKSNYPLLWNERWS